MADTTLDLIDSLPDLTIYAIARSLDASSDPDLVWNGTEWVAYDVGDWADYDISAPESPASSGNYSAAFPTSSSAGYYAWTFYVRVGGTPASTDPEAGFGSGYWTGATFSATFPLPGPNSAVDLITSAYAVQVLAASGITLNTEQAALLPTLITSASREIIRFTNQPFVAQAFDEVVVPDGARWDRGEYAADKLSYFPIISIESVMTSRTTALTITNTSTTNQYATVVFTKTGDPEFLNLVFTGVTLSRMASGTLATNSLTFASYPTLTALATAINALGGGWGAAVTSGYELWPSTSLVGARAPKNAGGGGAELSVFTTPASGYSLDPRTGILSAGRSNGFGSSSTGWWVEDYLSNGYDCLGQFRVKYTAGYSIVPEDVQLVCAEMVKGAFQRLERDMDLKSESAGDYSYTMMNIMSNLTDSMTSVLTRRKDKWI